ncbi:glycosyltransferase family 4 protein [Pontibacter pamirensis]|uniref:glycosyltransferase family 4 protein n=1 Tax=Pontibacter pamirensis TaxID=2562824 RepID=UPI00138981BE|nr:glycosyltransferase family 4 protein [Pontibacter pamirensis]
MRILKILNSKDRGGVYIYEVQFIKELKKRGYIVDAVIVGEGERTEEYQSLCNISYKIPYLDALYSGPIPRILNSMLKSYKFGVKYAKFVSEQIESDQAYDAIMYCRPNFIHLAGLLSQMISSKSFWHLPNTVNGKVSKAFYNFYCDKYGITSIGNSVYTKNTLGDSCKHVVYMAYDEERVQKSETNFREKLGIDKNAPVYGVAARLHKDKAQDVVVEAFVKSAIPKMGGHLLVAGGPLDSEFAGEVQKLAKDLLGKQVHFLGDISDLPMFYSSVDIVINGRRNAEPFGISVAEALGAGKPVIAYYLGGPSEMVEHNENGWLVSKPDVENFTLAYNDSIGARERWASMGRDAKSRSMRYGVESNVDRLIDIIELSKEYA